MATTNARLQELENEVTNLRLELSALQEQVRLLSRTVAKLKK